MGKKDIKETYKEWECPKCNETYSSPIAVFEVRCGSCSKQLSKRETWMKPLVSDK